jgi:hypothetical protein
MESTLWKAESRAVDLPGPWKQELVATDPPPLFPLVPAAMGHKPSALG